MELYPRPREEGSDYINATYLAVRIGPSLLDNYMEFCLKFALRLYFVYTVSLCLAISNLLSYQGSLLSISVKLISKLCVISKP